MTVPGETVVEGIGATQKFTSVCREGIGDHTVVRGTGEVGGLGGGGQRKKNQYIEKFRI